MAQHKAGHRQRFTQLTFLLTKKATPPNGRASQLSQFQQHLSKMISTLNQQPKQKGPRSIEPPPYTSRRSPRVPQSSERDKQDSTTGLRLMGTIALLGTPLLVCTMRNFLQDVHKLRWKDRKEYREYEDIRKEWNKIAKQEQRHRQIVGRSIVDYAEKYKLSPHQHMDLHALNNTLYFPSRKRLCHPAINSLRHSWHRARYEVLKTGSLKDSTVPPQVIEKALCKAVLTSVASQGAFVRFADVVGHRAPSFEPIQKSRYEPPGGVPDTDEDLTERIECARRFLDHGSCSIWIALRCTCSSPFCQIEAMMSRRRVIRVVPWADSGA